MLVAAGQIIGLDGAFEVVTRARQITSPEGAHAEEIPSFGLRDRIMAFMVDERLAELAALVETAALQPGEAETAEIAAQALYNVTRNAALLPDQAAQRSTPGSELRTNRLRRR